MQRHPSDEVSYAKQVWDKLLRKVTGKYEEVKQIEIGRVNSVYLAHFAELPEILNLGEDYSNRLELSTQSFKLEYWTNQLKGYFYNQAERFINTMCSYEISKMNQFINGYTDDSVHLLFHVLKKWAVNLSNTHYDEDDIADARRYQLFIKDLITQQIFKASNIDSRVQVLFSLEEILRKEIIPYLSYYRENKSAQQQLKTVSSHLEKFFNHVIKYLFYIGRDSKYIPNISHIKILSLAGDINYPQPDNLTEFEMSGWGQTRNTLPLKWLTQLIKKDLTMFTQMRPVCITNSTSIELAENSTQNDNIFSNIKSQLSDGVFDYKKNKYPVHIDLRTYVNIHVFMQEIIHFRILFSSAEQCAEMGGNLLAFGLLKGELTEDINDCLHCLHLIMLYCEKLEQQAWQAYKDLAFSSKDKSLAYVSEDWQENYSQSGQSYFRQLEREYQSCKEELSQLAAAANKKTTQMLIDETKEKISLYLALHNNHRNKREKILYYDAALNIDLNRKHPIQDQYLLDTPEQLYKNIMGMSKQNDQSSMEKILLMGAKLTSLSNGDTATTQALYYSSKFFSNTSKGENQQQEKLTSLLNKAPGHIKGLYLQAKLYYEQNEIGKALATLALSKENATKVGIVYTKTQNLHDQITYIKSLSEKAKLYSKQNEIEKALEVFKQIKDYAKDVMGIEYPNAENLYNEITQGKQPIVKSKLNYNG